MKSRTPGAARLDLRQCIGATAVLLTAALAGGAAAPGSAATQDRKAKPSIELRVTPPMGVAPLRVVATAELRGGADDYTDFYCPKIEWDWADGARSATTDDCSPYEAGKSEIRRRFSQLHTYAEAGVYRIVFQMKQGTRSVGSATIKIEVHGG
jgi:hypothetical protein